MSKIWIESSGLIVSADDVHAVCKSDGAAAPDGHYQSLAHRRGVPAPSVQVYTRLRLSGRHEPLLDLTLTGDPALDLWEKLGAPNDPGAGFVHCNRWYLRLGRVKLIKHPETSSPNGIAAPYDVYMSMVDGGRDDGWVARLQLDLESGRELVKCLHSSTPPVSAARTATTRQTARPDAVPTGRRHNNANR